MDNQQKAEKALAEFLKELGKKGFSKSIKKHLNLVWQEDEVFNKTLKKLGNIKYKIGSTKFISYNSPQKQYRFEVEINKEITNIFVQPLHEPGIPCDTGHYGIIPTKLTKFSKVLDEAIKEIGKDIAKIKPQMQVEKDHQEIYLQYLKDGGKAEDFKDWLKQMNKAGGDAGKIADQLKNSTISLIKKASNEEILQDAKDNFKIDEKQIKEQKSK